MKAHKIKELSKLTQLWGQFDGSQRISDLRIKGLVTSLSSWEEN